MKKSANTFSLALQKQQYFPKGLVVIHDFSQGCQIKKQNYNICYSVDKNLSCSFFLQK